MTDERRSRGFADCRGRVGCSWPGLIEAYRDRLPMAADWTAVTLKEGGTPLVPAPRLSEKTGCTVHIKVEGLNPTGSFKDRGMTMAVTEAVAHGKKAVLFGRMVPGIRSLLSLPAGMSEMPMPKFLLFSAIGSGLWASLLAGAGFALGENYDRVEQYVGPASRIILGLLAVAAVAWFIRRKREQEHAEV